MSTDRHAELRERLMALPKEALVELLVDGAKPEQAPHERVPITEANENTEKVAPTLIDIAEVERRLHRAIHVRGYIDYRGATMYAMQVEEALEAIENVLASTQRAEALRLVEVAFRTLTASLGNVDDSGEINDALEQIKALHLRACEVSGVEPKTLAAKLVEIKSADDLCVLDNVRESYAHLLGEKGRAEFDRIVRDAWNALPMLGPNERAHERDDRRGGLRGLMLCIVGDNIEEQIEIAKKDLSTPASFEHIARLCLRAGQQNRAVTWVQKGFKLFPRRDPRLIVFARGLYAQLGRHNDLVQLAFDDFVEKLDIATYRALKSACPTASWPAWRAKAVLHVEEQLGKSLKARTRNRWPKFADGTLLVEMLMAEDDVVAAKEAATRWGYSKPPSC